MSKTLNMGNRYKNLFLQQSYFDNTDLYSEILGQRREGLVLQTVRHLAADIPIAQRLARRDEVRRYPRP